MTQTEQKSSVLKSLITNINFETIGKAVNYLKVFGFKELINRLKKGYTPYTAYDTWFRDHRITADEAEQQKKKCFRYQPLISIAVPTYNTPVDMLKVMIDSVIDQTYSNWELCIADAGNPDHESRSVLKDYEKKDPRIKVRYLDDNYGIAGNTNQAMELALGEYTGLLDHDDFLEPDALFEVVARLNEYPYACLYTDEDKFDTTKGTFEEPNFKPDFNIDALRSHNYITHFFVAKTELIRSVGGEHSEYDGAQDYDLILRCTEKADKVCHIAKSLYHWRIYSGSTAGNPEQKLYCYEAGRKAIADHLERVGLNGTVELMPRPYWGMYHVKYTVSGNPLVSIIIPNYENKKVLERCINSIFSVNSYRNVEVIIVENNSSSEEIFSYYEQVQKKYDNVHVVNWKGSEFNYSAINNYGVGFAKGEYLLLLNNDTEMISQDAIEEMLGICMRDDVGVVGAKLLYPDNTVQHAGVMVGIGGTAGHLFSRILNQDPGYMMRAILNYDLSAVTGACLMTKKDIYQKVGGLDETLKVAYNDVDYCLKVRAEDRLVVYNAYSQWYHYESVSRGYETDIRKIRRFDSEVKLFQNKWKKVIVDGDPYYNRNLMDERIAK
ncbi:MAG: glycosyltransferase [Bulleidia sp.]